MALGYLIETYGTQRINEDSQKPVRNELYRSPQRNSDGRKREQMNKPHIRLSHWKLNHLENHSFGIVCLMKSVHMMHREK